MHQQRGDKITLNIILPRSIVQQLDAQAAREGGQSRVGLIRRACAEALERWRPATGRLEERDQTP